MLLDLSESLACPVCGPPQAIIVLVERIVEGRVIDGRLDCPGCESRFPLSGGTVDFGLTTSGLPADAAAVTGDEPEGTPDAAQDAITAAALLGIRHGRGFLVAGPGLASAAGRIGSLCGGCEVMLLGSGADRSDPGPGMEDGIATLSLFTGVPSDRIPVLSSRAVGIVLEGGGSVILAESARVLAPGGRAVVLRPAPGVQEILSRPPFETLAADPRAIVARRT